MPVMFIEFAENYGRFRSQNNFIQILFTLSFAAFFLAGCNNSELSARAEANQRDVPIKVTTIAVQALKIAQPVTLSGFTEPIHRATPAARIMAKVIESSFHEGDRVAAEKILIRLDTRDLMARKRQAQATIETVSTTLDVAKLNMDRMRNLQKSGSVSRHQLETTEVAYAQANASVAAAKSALDEIDVTLSYSVARAPFKGVIVRKMVENGNMVAPGQPLFIIEDDSHLRIIAPVGTDLTAGLKPGEMLTVRMGGETVQGVIEGVVPSGSTEAPGLRVQLIIDNPQHRFKAGTLAVVEVPLIQTEATRILVPKTVLIEKGRLTGAYVITKDKTARLHWLILGENPGDMACVLSGLKEGDHVILSPEKSGVTDNRSVEENNR